MTDDMVELVDLPDPAVQPLVHPLDLSEARTWFRRCWLVGVVTSPSIALCVAGLVWFATQSYVAPLVVAAVLIAIGAVAAHYLSDCAWEYIPRRRQDRKRPLPVTWELGSSMLFAVLLAAVVLLVARRLGQSDIPNEVRSVILGMGAAVAAIVVAEFGAKLLRRHAQARRAVWLSLPVVVVVVGCVAAAYAMLLDAEGPTSTTLVVIGAIGMLVMGALAALLRHVGLVH